MLVEKRLSYFADEIGCDEDESSSAVGDLDFIHVLDSTSYVFA